MPGLYIHPQPYNIRAIVLWCVAVLLLGAGAVTMWFAWDYYNTGTKPPVIGNALQLSVGDDEVSEDPVSDDEKRTHTVPADEPRYISLPDIGIEGARVFSVGLTEDGAIGAPSNIYDAAWYKDSAHPGDGSGVVLIDAHNSSSDGTSVFAAAEQLKSGATIRIERGDGEKFTYVVESVKKMKLEDVNEYGMRDLLGSTGQNEETLAFITCGGTYIPRIGTHDHRIIVQAVRAE